MMECGEQCATVAGVHLMHKSCVGSLGIQLEVLHIVVSLYSSPDNLQ